MFLKNTAQFAQLKKKYKNFENLSFKYITNNN